MGSMTQWHDPYWDRQDRLSSRRRIFQVAAVSIACWLTLGVLGWAASAAVGGM